jgi:hypothetical protein
LRPDGLTKGTRFGETDANARAQRPRRCHLGACAARGTAMRDESPPLLSLVTIGLASRCDAATQLVLGNERVN